jgi:hypothetical protein
MSNLQGLRIIQLQDHQKFLGSKFVEMIITQVDFECFQFQGLEYFCLDRL